VNPQTTANNETRGWIFYDAGCSLCACSAARVSQMLERRGFRLLPLQTPGTAERLGVTPEALLARMHVLTADGRRLAGADAFIEITRHVRWAWPLVAVTRLPVVLPLLRRCYDWVAANRYCFGRTCSSAPCKANEDEAAANSPQLKRVSRRKTKRVFFEMP
jgi:predicted DCC family thiol-disulfide oxidoreductase YuxK